MTVEAIERKAGPYDFTAGGQYPFYFKVFDKTDIFVVVTNTDGVETTINADTDYSVTINDDQDENAGGSVTLIKDYANHKITIGSQVPYDQSVIITNKGGFYPDTLNKAYDKLTILCQQNKEELKRAIKVDISSNTSADDYKEELEELVDQSVTSAASAAASAQQAVTASSKAVSDAATAPEQTKTALTQSGTAPIQSSTALENSVSAVNSIQPALEAAQKASSDAAEAVTKSEQALSETAAIDDKVDAAVDAALSGAVIPGLTPETIAGALGYTPYDAEENSQDFATTEEVSGQITEATNAIQAVIDAIPEPVNADWSATDGKAQILNKPVLAAVATSGDYNDLTNIPSVIPAGLIALWSGSADAIPSGWALCDGNNGTPDLRDRFVVGAGLSQPVGAIGGAAPQTATISGNTGATTLDINTMPSHSHTLRRGSGEGRDYMATGQVYVPAQWVTTDAAGGSQPHAHSLNGSATVNVLPPYYALCYIMKQ